MKKQHITLLCVLLFGCSIHLNAENKGGSLLQYSGEPHKNISCGDITELSEAAAYTIEMWVKFPLSQSYTTLFSKMNADESVRIELQVLSSGQMVIYQRNKDGEYMQSEVGAYPNDDAWHHLALVYSGGKPSVTKVYLDGAGLKLNGNGFAATTGNTTGYPFIIGKPSQAQYDEVRVWNTALSAATLTTWNRFKINDTHPAYDNLVACYSFDNATEGVIPDLKNKYPAAYDTQFVEVTNIDLTITEKIPEVALPNNGMQLLEYSGEDFKNMICGDIEPLNNAAEYTIEAWVKIDLSSQDYFVIFKKEKNDAERIKVQLQKNGDIYIMQNGAYCNSGGGKYPNDGAWHHLAVVYGSGEATLYVDGEKLTSGSSFGAKTPHMSSSPFVIGGPSTASYDEVRVWDKALTEKELADYRSKKVNAAHPSEGNLVAYYNFEGKITSQVPDLKGNYPATVSAQMDIVPIVLNITNNENSSTKTGIAIEQTVNIYPTVIEDGFTVNCGEESMAIEVHIYNANLRLLKTVTTVGTNSFVNVADLPAGIYYVKMVNKDQITVRPIIKK